VTHPILGVEVAASNYEEIIQHSLRWAAARQSRCFFFAAVHMIMESADDPAFLPRLNRAGTVLPDGRPLVWALHLLGEKKARQVCGPDFTPAMLAAAEKAGEPVGFYGGTPDGLEALLDAVRMRYPQLRVAYAESPPFRALSPEEDRAVVQRMTASGAHLLFVGLGCPKQERWMVDHIGKVQAVMFAVGAAFDFLAGTKRRAPCWMNRCGIEWVYRLAAEPKRLAKRYCKHNPRFVFYFFCQLLAGAGHGLSSRHFNAGRIAL
jgi:N-acetylglucosaminyldiphosphoundecaprenol N-acetyl-beta-D-mannosaminyltransferase